MIIVLFSTVARQDVDVEDYQRTSARMRELVSIIPGFISYNAYAGETGEGNGRRPLRLGGGPGSLAGPPRAPASAGEGPVFLLPRLLGPGVLDDS